MQFNFRQNRQNDDCLDQLDGYLAHHTNTGLLFLDKKCRFLFTNPAGEMLLAEGKVVSSERGEILLHDENAQAALLQQFEHYRISDESRFDLHLPPIKISPNNFLPPVHVQMRKLPYPMRGPGGKRSSYCLFINSSIHNEESLIVILNQLYGLTRSETDLVVAFCASHSLKLASDQLDIAYNTGRVHFRNSLRKMRLNSQTQLIQAIEQLSAWRRM